MNEQLTAFQKLDEVLTFFAKGGFEKGGLDFDHTLRLVNEHTKLKTDGDLLVKILNHLLKDEYIIRDTREIFKHLTQGKEPVYRTLYHLTFEGEVFRNSGGYQGRANRQNAENTRLDAVEAYQRGQARTLNRLTGWIAGGTIALALIELWKMAFEHHWFSFFR